MMLTCRKRRDDSKKYTWTNYSCKISQASEILKTLYEYEKDDDIIDYFKKLPEKYVSLYGSKFEPMKADCQKFAMLLVDNKKYNFVHQRNDSTFIDYVRDDKRFIDKNKKNETRQNDLIENSIINELTNIFINNLKLKYYSEIKKDSEKVKNCVNLDGDINKIS